MASTKVTRNGQITLSKEIRDDLDIHEGDDVFINRIQDKVIITKKDVSVWGNIGSFLPENFEGVLKKIRKNSRIRFRELGIIQ